MAKSAKGSIKSAGSRIPPDVLAAAGDVVAAAQAASAPLTKRAVRELGKLGRKLEAARATETKRLRQDMGDKIRVTVVATGLGRQAAKANAPMRVIRRQAAQQSLEPNYQVLDKPTVQRKRAVGDGLRDGGLQEELLDIPAFLRRQAD